MALIKTANVRKIYKNKMVLVPKYHAMKMYRAEEDPHHVFFTSRCEISFMLRLLNLGERAPPLPSAYWI
jgi:hypothetical protein